MKRPPPLLLGLTLLFWGWQTGFLVTGIVTGCLLEAGRLSKRRWELTDEDFVRIWTLCSVLLLAAAAYAFTSNEGPSNFLGFFHHPDPLTQREASAAGARATTSLMRWLPMIFFPFMAAQTFSPRQGIPLHVMSLILRRRWLRARARGQSPPDSPSLNVSYPYFGLCLFAASLHPGQGNAFFWGLCALLGAALWFERPGYYRGGAWIAAMALAAGFGFLSQQGIARLQHYLGDIDPRWFSRFSHRGFDPTRVKTRLGDISRKELSGTIVIRLELPKSGHEAPPRLLREATYRTYRSRVWSADNTARDFREIHEKPPGTFVLLPRQTNTETVNISCYLPGGKGLLPLPTGAGQLDDLGVYVLDESDLGAVYAEGPGLVIFDARFGARATIDSAPEPGDEAVPEVERPALEEVISGLHVRGRSFEQTLQTLQRFFLRHFTYSLAEAPDRFNVPGETPLSRFLLRTRQGHCEYFATATVLLLRELGIPARYAVGYAVHEAAGDGEYIVRQRDAHAWCLVWNRRARRWQNFDTTPGSWIGLEAEQASALQWLSDLWSDISFEFAKMRWGQTPLRRYIFTALAPVLIVLILRILIQAWRRRPRPLAPKTSDSRRRPGLDSEFYEIEKRLAKQGLPREAGEPLSRWLRRVLGDSRLGPLGEPLRQLLDLHYRYRFDPASLSRPEREALRRESATCLARLDQAVGPHP